VHAWGVTVANYNNFSVKTNMKLEILTSGNAFAPFYITKMTSLHATWTWFSSINTVTSSYATLKAYFNLFIASLVSLTQLFPGIFG
jgi:hypothetical protein